jgi:hypothetical protein
LAKFWAVKEKKKKKKKKGRSVLDQSHGQTDLSFDALLFLDHILIGTCQALLEEI